jgi:YtkA-like
METPMAQGIQLSLWRCFLYCLLAGLSLTACSRAVSNPVSPNEAGAKQLSKTVFTEKVGAYLVYQPLKPGKPSEFALHLTDLAEGTPIGQAEVSLTVRAKAGQSPTQIKAEAGKTAGIYLAQVTLPKAGEYDIEFEIKHAKFTGRLTVTDFDAE